MAGPFGYDSNLTGLWVVVEQEPLCRGCRSADEVDAEISRLKADLDRVALEMKAELRKQDG
jgi:hypothetical protein